MRKTVFYVDDDFNSLKALKRLFHRESVHLVIYDSPIKALDKLDTVNPSVVISDQRMPEMDGTVFLEKVKKKQPETVRILLTGYADIEVAITAINQGNIFRYLRKPWDDDELKTAVQSALDYQDSIFCLRNIVDSLIDEIFEHQKDQKSVRKLTATIADELKHPLMIIEKYIQLMQTHAKSDGILNAYLSNIVLQTSLIRELAKKIESAPASP